MNSNFTLDDFREAIPRIEKTHPFLPDRRWLVEDVEHKIENLQNQVNQNKWSFDTIECHFEWLGKARPSVRMSSADWLVHFVIEHRLEQELQTSLIPNTAYQVSAIDQLAAQCCNWRGSHKDHWVLQTDVASFFGNIQHELLLANLEQLLPNQSLLFKMVKTYLAASEKAMANLAATSTDTFMHSPEIGLPIGAELNYLLASVYLRPLDLAINHAEAASYYARYLDDVLIFSKEKKDLLLLKELLLKKLKDLGLEINSAKTLIQQPGDSIHFLQEDM